MSVRRFLAPIAWVMVAAAGWAAACFYGLLFALMVVFRDACIVPENAGCDPVPVTDLILTGILAAGAAAVGWLSFRRLRISLRRNRRLWDPDHGRHSRLREETSVHRTPNERSRMMR